MTRVKYAVKMKDVKPVEVINNGVVAIGEVDYENELPYDEDGNHHTSEEWQEHYQQVLMSIVGSMLELVMEDENATV